MEALGCGLMDRLNSFSVAWGKLHCSCETHHQPWFSQGETSMTPTSLIEGTLKSTQTAVPLAGGQQHLVPSGIGTDKGTTTVAFN